MYCHTSNGLMPKTNCKTRTIAAIPMAAVMLAFTTLISKINTTQHTSKVIITISEVVIIIVTSTGMARLQWGWGLILKFFNVYASNRLAISARIPLLYPMLRADASGTAGGTESAKSKIWKIATMQYLQSRSPALNDRLLLPFVKQCEASA